MASSEQNSNSAKQRCYDCGGEVEAEVVGDFKDWVCQDCGIIVGGGLLVEEQEEYVEEDVEVME